MARPTRDTNNVSRERTKRNTKYSPGSVLDFPDYVKEHFAKKGQYLVWVRHKIHGEYDEMNISKMLREGYQFVFLKDLPDDYLDAVSGTTIKNVRKAQGDYEDITSVGDLVLMNHEFEYRKNRMEAIAEKARKPFEEQAQKIKDLNNENKYVSVESDVVSDILTVN